MTLKLSMLSTEYVRVSVAARESGTAVNPTTDTVYMAFKTDAADPSIGDWVLGSWENDGQTHYARVLIGPDGHGLSVGSYNVWVKVVDNPEEPVRKAGKLVIF